MWCRTWNNYLTSRVLSATARIITAVFVVIHCFQPFATSVLYNVNCGQDVMVVTVNATEKPLPLIYLQNLKGYAACEPVTAGGASVFQLSLNTTGHPACGLTKMLNKQTGQSIFYHHVVVEQSPKKEVELLLIQCILPGDFNMDFVRLDWQKEALPLNDTKAMKDVLEWNTDSRQAPPYLQMVLRQKGSPLDTSVVVRPGTQLDLLVYLDQENAVRYGLSLRYLTLTDEVRSQEEVVVMNGCSVDPYVIEVLRPEGGVLKSHFRAFKFQSSQYLVFLATINVCLHHCVEVECYGPAAKDGGKRKREIPRYLPHYRNELFEVEMTAAIQIQTDVQGDIIVEESTNDTLDSLLYENGEDYTEGISSSLGKDKKGTSMLLAVCLFCLFLTKRLQLLSFERNLS